MDRMDLFVGMPPVAVSDLRRDADGEPSVSIKTRIEKAQDIQGSRNGAGRLNALLTPEDIDRFCAMDGETSSFFDKAIESMKLSARGYYRVLKVARTIADLDGGAEMLSKSHMAEALSFRPRIYLNT